MFWDPYIVDKHHSACEWQFILGLEKGRTKETHHMGGARLNYRATD